MISAFEKDFVELVSSVVAKGQPKESRVGQTVSCFGTTLRINSLREGKFPILTGRQVFYKPVFGELAAFLRGAQALSIYKNYGCNYWDQNAEVWYENKGVEKKYWLVGKVYGAQWRYWTTGENEVPLNQLKMLIRSITEDPFSRRHLLTTYNPAELDQACLPPCHLLAQFNVTPDGFLDCMVTMRSVDLCLGLPSDIVLYAALLLIVAQQTKYKPGSLVFMMGDSHVYRNHLVTWVTQSLSKTHPLPTWKLDERATVDSFIPEDLVLLDYVYEEPIRYMLNV